MYRYTFATSIGLVDPELTYAVGLQVDREFVVAGVLAGLRITGQPLAEQRFVYLGAGEACSGTRELLCTAMRAEGVAVAASTRSRHPFTAVVTKGSARPIAGTSWSSKKS